MDKDRDLGSKIREKGEIFSQAKAHLLELLHKVRLDWESSWHTPDKLPHVNL